MICNLQFSDSTPIRNAQLDSTRICTWTTRFDSHSQNLDSNPSLGGGASGEQHGGGSDSESGSAKIWPGWPRPWPSTPVRRTTTLPAFPRPRPPPTKFKAGRQHLSKTRVSIVEGKVKVVVAHRGSSLNNIFSWFRSGVRVQVDRVPAALGRSHSRVCEGGSEKGLSRSEKKMCVYLSSGQKYASLLLHGSKCVSSSNLDDYPRLPRSKFNTGCVCFFLYSNFAMVLLPLHWNTPPARVKLELNVF